MRIWKAAAVAVMTISSLGAPASAQRGGRGGAPADSFPTNIPPDDARITALKQEAIRMVDSMSTLTQQIVDQAVQLRRARLAGNRDVEVPHRRAREERLQGSSAASRAFPPPGCATWGSGKPVIALGSDIDGIPQASQKPGVGYRDPMIAGAPGHGEGHNSGQAVNIAAALAVKKIMEREKIPGTLMLWPGVAEEQMAGKAYLVRAGVFKDADAALFTHVGNEPRRVVGAERADGADLRRVQLPRAERARGGRAVARPQRARRRHADGHQRGSSGASTCRLQQRSHYVIKDGGDQPNVVPQTAHDLVLLPRDGLRPRCKQLFALGDTIARGRRA